MAIHKKIILVIALLFISIKAISVETLAEKHFFDVPQTRLDEAVSQLAIQAAHSALFSPAEVKHIHSNAVNGEYTLIKALDIALSGTSFVARVSEDRVITLHSLNKKNNSDEEKPMLTKNLSGKKQFKTKAGCLRAAVGAVAASACLSAAYAQEDNILSLEEVVVTATKRAQSVQDVSASVSAISPEDLTDRQITNLEDLQVAMPGLTVGNDFAIAKIYVRGIGLNSSLPGMDPSVALHVDGAVVANATQHFSSLFDVERVEVLRGPQGTLYGRNATGGSINVISAKPTEDFESYINLTAGGSDLNLIGEAAVSGPLSDSIQGRVAVRYENRDGYGEYTRTGEDIDDSNKRAIRAQLNFDISESVSNLLSFEYYEDDERSRTVKFFAPSFSQETIDALATDPLALAAVGGDQALLDSLLANNLPSLVTDAPVNSRNVGGGQAPVGQLETMSITNTFDWQINDFLSFRSLSNYREGENTLVQDFDVSNADSTPSTVQLQYVENEQLSQEFQLNFDGERFRGLIGFFYFDEEQGVSVPIGEDPEAAFDITGRSVDGSFSSSLIDGVAAADPDAQPILGDTFPAARVILPGLMNVEAYALFANFTFDITEAMRIKLGARQSEEDRDIIVETRIPGAAGGLGVTISVGEDERSYSAFTPELGLEFDVGETLLYAGYSEGFKSGVAALVDGTPELINPEDISNFEVGAKGSYLDGRINLNAAAFYYEIEDVQYDRTSLIAGGPRFSTSVENAGETTGKGLELEGAFQATAELRLDFNATWYEIEFDTFDTTNPLDPYGALQGLAGQPVDRVDLSGNRVRNTPEYSVGLRGTYTQTMDSGSEMDYAVGYSYKGDQYFTEFNDERMSTDAYGILDANIKFTSADGSWFVNLWGKNLTDEFVKSGAFAISTSRTITGTYLPPRQYGVTVGYDF